MLIVHQPPENHPFNDCLLDNSTEALQVDIDYLIFNLSHYLQRNFVPH